MITRENMAAAIHVVCRMRHLSRTQLAEMVNLPERSISAHAMTDAIMIPAITARIASALCTSPDALIKIALAHKRVCDMTDEERQKSVDVFNNICRNQQISVDQLVESTRLRYMDVLNMRDGLLPKNRLAEFAVLLTTVESMALLES